ncbi:MAG: hypothetical protein IPN44_07725 [Flavobacteriales bacterium]|nr:hypothetical protein [Flavobacteriales bacterium]
MTPKQARLTVLIIFGLFIFWRLCYPPVVNVDKWNTAIGISIELIGGIVLLGLLSFLQNVHRLWFYFQTTVLLRNEEIRLSIAYLYRIKVDDKYLLVKNTRRELFQPVGGVYKTLPGSEKIFRELDIRPDRHINTELGIAKGDLRVHVPGKHVLEFLDWFDSKQDRETSPWREFCEELLTTGILNHTKAFRYIDYHFRGTIRTPIIELDTGGKGMFQFDIFDLEINDEQRPVLEALLAEGDKPDYIWASSYLIDRLGHDEGTRTRVYEIAKHTKWAHNMKWSKG